jgi:hypothetical protein
MIPPGGRRGVGAIGPNSHGQNHAVSLVRRLKARYPQRLRLNLKPLSLTMSGFLRELPRLESRA